MTFCQRRKGTRRAGDQAGYVIGGRKERSDLGGMGSLLPKGTNQVLLSRGWFCVRSWRSDMYSSRPVSAASSLPSVFSPLGCAT